MPRKNTGCATPSLATRTLYGHSMDILMTKNTQYLNWFPRIESVTNLNPFSEVVLGARRALLAAGSFPLYPSHLFARSRWWWWFYFVSICFLPPHGNLDDHHHQVPERLLHLNDRPAVVLDVGQVLRKLLWKYCCLYWYNLISWSIKIRKIIQDEKLQLCRLLLYLLATLCRGLVHHQLSTWYQIWGPQWWR